MTKRDIIKLIKEDKWMMEVLTLAESLNLPDWWIGGGFIRGKVWDNLHGFKKRTPLPDIDIVYFDKKDYSKKEEQNFSTIAERKYQARLNKVRPEIKWSVTNQARMHIFHNENPYKSSRYALSRWVETATCVGVKINKGKIILVAPRGIDDLVNLIVRPTPIYAKDLKTFNQRVINKKWIKKWPKLKIILSQS